VFEKEENLYIIWWKHSHVTIKIKTLTTKSITARITVEVPSRWDLVEVLGQTVPQLDFKAREAEVSVTFNHSPVFVDLHEIIQSGSFYGLKVRRNLQGDIVQFDL